MEKKQMLGQAIARAILRLEQILASSYRTGREVGAAAAGLTVIAGTTKMITKTLQDGRKQDVSLQHKQDIHADRGSINTEGRGQRVGIIYQGNDGHFYKEANNRWYMWTGNDWA